MELIEFYVKVPKPGFKWIESRESLESEPNRFLVDASPIGILRTVQNVSIRKLDGLFMQFAHLRPTEEGVLEFANRYGLLGFPTMADSDTNPNRALIGIPGEKLANWSQEIRSMREAVKLHEQVRANSPELKQVITWGSGFVDYANPYGRSFRIADNSKPERMAKLSHGDMAGPGHYALQIMLNRTLREHPSVPKLFWDNDGKVPVLRMKLAPKNLLAAMWLQFALATEGSRNYRQCDVCGDWFEGPSENRDEGKKFCKQACRFKAYRQRQPERKAQAITLHSQGMSFTAIAKKLNVEKVSTVKGWIENK